MVRVTRCEGVQAHPGAVIQVLVLRKGSIVDMCKWCVSGVEVVWKRCGRGS